MSAPALPLAAIRQPAFLYHPDGTIAEANDLGEALAGRPLAGLTLDALVGILNVRTPDGILLFADEMPATRALAGEEAVDVPLVVMAADGRTVYILASASPIRDEGEIKGALVIWQDVSALETAVAEQVRLRLESQNRGEELEVQGEELRFQNEELMAIEEELRQSNTELQAAHDRLRQSEEQYRSLAENVPSVLMRYDPTLRVVYLSSQAERSTGIPASECIGRTNREAGMPGDLCTLWETAIAEVFRTGEPRDLEFDLPSPDGTQTFYLKFAPEFDPQGHVRHVLGISTEITGRKQAEENLRRISEQHAAILESISDSFMALDRDWRFTYINRRALGYLDLSPADAIGRSIWEVFPEIVGTSLDVFYRKAMESREPLTYVNQSVVATGKIFELRAYPSVEGLSIFGQDVTERRRAEVALREAEGHLARAQEIAHMGSWAWEVANDTLRWSDETFRIFGLQPGEIATPRNEDFLAFVHPDDRAEVARAVQDALVKGEYDVEFRFLRKGGGEGYAHSQAAVTFADGVPVRMEGTVQDITERRAVEDALRETRDYLDSLITYANAPIIVWSPDLRITRFNAAFEHLSGYAADEVIGRHLAVLFPEESRDASLAKIQRTITERWQSVEIPILRPDGGVRIALWNSANIYGEDGTTLLATIAQGQDITERKEAEEALRTNAENLQRSNEDLERFAYVSSHDLQEPLRAIVSFSQLLERRYRGKLDQDADDYIEFIVEGGIRMQALIQDLLAYSRVNTTKQMMTQTDTADVLASVERSIDASLREAGAVITHDPMPVVLADPTQLAQVMTNLVSNAIKFRKADVPLRIHVGVRRADGFCEFSVSDNGIGIEPEYFDRIFVIFQRLHTKDVYPGTGIGLAIVKRIIDRHGGRIWVESAPGGGSTFSFTLPAA